MSDLNFYERLFVRAYQMVEEGGRPQPRVLDDDLAMAYRLMMNMRGALLLCRDQFNQFVEQDEPHLTDHLSLVEQHALVERINRHKIIAQSITNIVKSMPVLPDDDWQDITTAPQDGQPLRLLGKRSDGSTYIETGTWLNIIWSVQQLKGYDAPTHWKYLDRLPKDYR